LPRQANNFPLLFLQNSAARAAHPHSISFFRKEPSMKKPLLLCILDGFGWVPDQTYGNAILAARTPNLDKLFAQYPYTTIGASGMNVGLPDGQMGNSEVGHTNIGAGRIVYQELTRITKDIQDGGFFENPALLGAVKNAAADGKALHLIGLLSNGGGPQPHRLHAPRPHRAASTATTSICMRCWSWQGAAA